MVRSGLSITRLLQHVRALGVRVAHRGRLARPFGEREVVAHVRLHRLFQHAFSLCGERVHTVECADHVAPVRLLNEIRNLL